MSKKKKSGKQKREAKTFFFNFSDKNLAKIHQIKNERKENK